MPSLTWYRQARADGGVRSGITLDRVEVFERFEPGPLERDPALRWYVDLRCQGGPLPSNADEIKQWFIDHSLVIREGFADFSNELRVGTDPDDYPLQWSRFHNAPVGVTLIIAASAVRQVDGREMATILRDIADHWLERIEAFGGELVTTE